MWEIRVDYVADWLLNQDEMTLAGIYAALDLLESQGPTLGRPLVDTLSHTKIPNLKELRPASPGTTEVRIIFAFDRQRRAIMLLGGDKSKGGSRAQWDKWYKRAIPEAEKRFLEHMQQEGANHGSDELSRVSRTSPRKQ